MLLRRAGGRICRGLSWLLWLPRYYGCMDNLRKQPRKPAGSGQGGQFDVGRLGGADLGRSGFENPYVVSGEVPVSARAVKRSALLEKYRQARLAKPKPDGSVAGAVGPLPEDVVKRMVALQDLKPGDVVFNVPIAGLDAHTRESLRDKPATAWEVESANFVADWDADHQFGGGGEYRVMLVSRATGDVAQYTLSVGAARAGEGTSFIRV